MPSHFSRQKTISTVSNQGFKKLVNTLDKRYAMPSRHHFTRVVLPALYDKCREEVANDDVIF